MLVRLGRSRYSDNWILRAPLLDIHFRCCFDDTRAIKPQRVILMELHTFAATLRFRIRTKRREPLWSQWEQVPATAIRGHRRRERIVYSLIYRIDQALRVKDDSAGVIPERDPDIALWPGDKRERLPDHPRRKEIRPDELHGSAIICLRGPLNLLRTPFAFIA